MARILIVEDEKPIRNLIKRNLELIGHNCIEAADGNTASVLIAQENFDLMLFDIMLPDQSGYELIEQTNGTPVIFLTAKESAADRIKGLSLGADDYIVKPFEMQELILRVGAVLRRTQKDEQVLRFDDIEVRFSSKKVYKNGTEVLLTPKEYDLLEALLRNRNIALTREKLICAVWGFDYEGDTRTVDVHIRQIRSKLGLGDHLKTLYKTGYRFEL